MAGRQRISDQDIRRYLESRTAGELVDLLMNVCARDPELRKALVDASALSSGRFDDLIAEARLELRAQTDVDAWRNGWTGEEHLPDYSRLETRLRALLDHGQADAVVELGEELRRRGTEQIDQAHDDGETAEAIAHCMAVMYEALLQSSRADGDKIIDAIDLILSDDYGICACFGMVSEGTWSKDTWSNVADQLQGRLGDQRIDRNKSSVENRQGRRGQLGAWVITALDRAGRTSEATEVCVAEARIASEYVRAVRRLIEMGDNERAAELAQAGLDTTSSERAGLLQQLQDLLSAIAASRGDWTVSAAVVADRFFERPDVRRYRELLEAAERAGHREAVKKAAMAFLEGGARPLPRRSDGRASKRSGHPWPLPEPPKSKRAATSAHSEHDGPHFDVLIALAISEKRPHDILHWYDNRAAFRTGKRWPTYAALGRDAAGVAEAIEETHPDRAIAIYIALANAIVGQTKPSTYPDAGRYLKRVRSLLESSGRADEWPGTIRTFRAEHRQKRRLMEVLDTMDHPAIAAKRKRG